MASFFVYLVKTARDTLYTGISTDPVRRTEEHNHSPRGARALRGQRPVQLIWQSAHALPRGEALRLEHRIKKLPRHMKLSLIAGELSLDDKPAESGSDAPRAQG